MTWIPRWTFAFRLATRLLVADRWPSILSVIAMAIPVSAVVATAVIVPSSLRGPDDDYVSATFWIWSEIVLTGNFAAIALVLVGAMVAAALLVSVRRHERMLAVLLGIGASRTTLGRVMSATGLVLGALAGVVAAIIGLVAGAIILSVNAVPVRHVEVLAIALTVVATIGIGWLVSLAAAVRASSTDVVTVLRDAPAPVRSIRKVARAGVLTLVSGCAGLAFVVLLGLLGQTLPFGFWTMMLSMGGRLLAFPAIVTILLGVLLTMPMLFRFAGNLASGIPGRGGLAARLAARDAERGGARSVAAAASIMLVTFLIGTYLTLIVSTDVSGANDYEWQQQQGQVSVDLLSESFDDDEKVAVDTVENPAGVASAVSEGFGSVRTRVLSGVLGPFWGYPVDDYEGYSGRQKMDFPKGGLPMPSMPADSACDQPFDQTGLNARACAESWAGFDLSPTRVAIWAGDIGDLEMILGHTADAETRAALDEGKAIALDPRNVAADGTVTIDWWGADDFVPEDEPGEFLPHGEPIKSVRFDGKLVSMDYRVASGVFISMAAADEAGLDAIPVRVLTEAVPGASQVDADAVDLSSFGPEIHAWVETGPIDVEPVWRWGAVALAFVLVLAIVVVAIALARTDGRRTDTTLASLGAARALRRQISGWYALIVAGFGAIAGAVLGAIVSSVQSAMYGATPAVPIAELLLIGVGAPLLAALGARFWPVAPVIEPVRE